MTKKSLNILLLLCLMILTVALGYVRMKDSQRMDYYQLNETCFLHKIDYFSSYAISKTMNSTYQDIVLNVKDIAINHDSIIVRYMKDHAIHYILLSNDRTLIQELNDPISINQINSNWDFIKPWIIVEQKTLNDGTKLLSQIIILSIIIIGFYLLMRVFNIKRLTKSP